MDDIKRSLFVKVLCEALAIGDRLYAYYAAVALGLKRGKNIRKGYADHEVTMSLEGKYAYLNA